MKKFFNQKTIYGSISLLTGVLFTAVVYNINFANNTNRYFCIFIFYFLFFLIVFKKNQSLIFTAIVVALLPIIIDASVLITNPRLVPLRFPYATTFILMGCIGGFLYIKKKRSISFYFLFVIFYFVIGHYFLIPQILFSILQRDIDKEPKYNGIINERFYGVDRKPVKLHDTLNKKYTLIDCYFVGCRPCEEKLTLLKKIRNIYKNDELSIIMICNGAVSAWDIYLENYSKKNIYNVVYLYDKDTVLNKYNINSYPTEFILKKTDIIHYEVGYTKESEQLYFINKKKILSKLQYENIKN
jgi:hypothetical protein